eukprot:3278255-Prymnesium_polylepis.2
MAQRDAVVLRDRRVDSGVVVVAVEALHRQLVELILLDVAGVNLVELVPDHGIACSPHRLLPLELCGVVEVVVKVIGVDNALADADR